MYGYEMALGTQVESLLESYADGAYMLALCNAPLSLMLLATSQCVRLIGQEIHVKKSLFFAMQHKVQGKTQHPEAGGNCRCNMSFSQLGIGGCMQPRKGSGSQGARGQESPQQGTHVADGV